MVEVSDEINSEQTIIKPKKKQFYKNRTIQINFLAFFIGIVGALAAYSFRLMINLVQEGSSLFTNFMTQYNIPMYVPTIILLVIAASISGPIIAKWAREAKGHGVPEVIEAVELKQGRIRARVPFIKAGVSSLAIGTGMSLGSEGPIVQIAGGVASYIAQKAKFRPLDIKLLVVCGISAGISAIFNAPLGGVLFGLEAILMSLTITAILPVLLSSLVASILSRILMESNPIFSVPIFNIDFGIIVSEMWIFVLIGIVAGLAGIMFQGSLYLFENLVDRLKKIPLTVKLIVGALLTGLISIWFPEVLGVGYDQISIFLAYTNTSQTESVFRIIFLGSLILFVMKLLTTSIAIGSGASGGIFAPGLYLGAAIGAALGGLFHAFLPLQTPIGLWALLGMAAVFGGAARVPFTMIIMTAELTGDYYVFLPLMITVFISYWMNESVNKYSIYTKKLAVKGIVLKRAMLEEYLENFPVIDIMTKDVVAFSEDISVSEIINVAQIYHFHAYPLINEKGILKGLITLDDIYNAQIKGDLHEPVSKYAICSPEIYCTPFESVKVVLDRMYSNRLGRLAVLKSDKDKTVVGIITESDVINIIESQSLRVLQDKRKALNLKDLEKIKEEGIQLEKSTFLKKKVKHLHLTVITGKKQRKLIDEPSDGKKTLMRTYENWKQKRANSKVEHQKNEKQKKIGKNDAR
ncbi:MAG: chloride channel protein [Candidatus Heimdallarchaeota archaeon]|nr:chloride channel protein [Candidatus Heimdallarchaeota archaeon]